MIILKDEWQGFTPGEWCEGINVSDFIKKNYNSHVPTVKSQIVLLRYIWQNQIDSYEAAAFLWK